MVALPLVLGSNQRDLLGERSAPGSCTPRCRGRRSSAPRTRSTSSSPPQPSESAVGALLLCQQNAEQSASALAREQERSSRVRGSRRCRSVLQVVHDASGPLL